MTGARSRSAPSVRRIAIAGERRSPGQARKRATFASLRKTRGFRKRSERSGLAMSKRREGAVVHVTLRYSDHQRRSELLSELVARRNQRRGTSSMKAIAQFVRTTIVGGVFFLAPIVVLIVILAKAFGFAKKGLHAVLVHFPGDFGLERRRGDGAFDRDHRARLPSCWARRPYRDRPTLRQRIGVVGAVEDSGLRISETGERKRAWASPRSGSFPWSSCPWKGDGSSAFKPKR